MKRLIIGAVGLALVVGATVACGSANGALPVQPTPTWDPVSEAAYEASLETPTPMPLLTEYDVKSAVMGFILEKCDEFYGPAWVEKSEFEWTTTNCENSAVGADAYDDSWGAATSRLRDECEATYRNDRKTWVVRCPLEGAGDRHRTYFVDDDTGEVDAPGRPGERSW